MKNNDIEKLLYLIKIKWQIALNQEDLFTHNHTRFECLLKYHDKHYSFDYQCNTNYSTPNKLDLLNAIFLDSECFSESVVSDDDLENMQEFAINFGYDTNKQVKELINAFKGCKRSYSNLHNIFTKEEYNLLLEYLREEV